jgi:hypothetical protein
VGEQAIQQLVGLRAVVRAGAFEQRDGLGERAALGGSGGGNQGVVQGFDRLSPNGVFRRWDGRFDRLSANGGLHRSAQFNRHPIPRSGWACRSLTPHSG